MQLFLCPVLPCFHSLIFAASFKAFLTVFLVIGSMVGAGFLSFGFFDFSPYAFALQLRKLYLFGQLIFKSADMVEIYLNAVNGVF